MDNKKSLKDHRQIGQELDLFTTSELVGSGLPLITPKGAVIRGIIEKYIHDLLEKHGYQHVWTPHIARKELYEKSGHLEKFSEDMFPVMRAKERDYVLKAMNCPHHIQIFARHPMSYREMPQRYAETSTVYRSEQSGELGGLTRVLSISIDDAHVFCTKEQIREEFETALKIDKEMLRDFNFNKYWIRLSLWDPKNKKKYLGNEKDWESNQKLMRELLLETKTPFKEVTGEAAFYGPKMDLMVIDSHGREWQLSTIQLDFNLPQRFGISFVGEDGKNHQPYIIHRATYGSVERFMGVWLEHIQGSIPLWLAPIQVLVMPIVDKQENYARRITEDLKKEGIRAELDNRPERLQAKIRDGALQKVPYLGIIGDREIEDSSISVRMRDGKDLGKLKVSDFLQKLKEEIDKKI
jgi:threonyl-tRNA synthetase